MVTLNISMTYAPGAEQLRTGQRTQGSIFGPTVVPPPTSDSIGQPTHPDVKDTSTRPHPKSTFLQTVIPRTSFFGSLRDLYGSRVLLAQLEQLKKQGSYYAWDLKWRDVYEVRPLIKGRCNVGGNPPSLFWESDVAKWIEAASYFLGTHTVHSNTSPHFHIHDEDRDRETLSPELATTFRNAIDHLIDLIARAQQPDGYLNIYFTVVDPEGKWMNLRDLHEFYNMGHMVEAALADYHTTGSRKFLDVMIKCVNCFERRFGPAPHQLHGYPGHPEAELAIFRLYAVTRDPKHKAFAEWLVKGRGVKRDDQGGEGYYPWEAKVRRKDKNFASNFEGIEDEYMEYNLSHLPLHDQNEIIGHAVRAFYLITAAADYGGAFLDDAKRIWTNAVDKKMYVTGGFGSIPRIEGFSKQPYHLPNSTDEGGCYAETCAAIGCMMTSERILSHALDGKVRDVLELCLYNAVLGGASLDGKGFAYANKHATSVGETAERSEWFEVACCPPNLARTLGMLGGYIWTSTVLPLDNIVELNVYLYISATKVIGLSGEGRVVVKMESAMPWQGRVAITVEAPPGWTVKLAVPTPDYAEHAKFSKRTEPLVRGYVAVALSDGESLDVNFDMPIRLLTPHPSTKQDTLTVTKGPIVFTAEDIDNDAVESAYPHFKRVGLSVDAQFEEKRVELQGVSIVMLRTVGERAVFGLEPELEEEPLYRVAGVKSAPVRRWTGLKHGLTFVPWFARANRGGRGHLRTSLLRVGGEVVE